MIFCKAVLQDSQDDRIKIVFDTKINFFALKNFLFEKNLTTSQVFETRQSRIRVMNSIFMNYDI